MRLSSQWKMNRGGYAAASTAALVGFLSVGVACFARGATAQGDDLFAACASDMEKSPGDAFESCSRFLKESPAGDSANIQKAKDWLGMNAPKRPFVRYLKSLSRDDKARFVVYQPDLTIDLPQVDRKTRTGKVKIKRSFGNLTEEAMVRKAEAVYPSPSEMIHQLFWLWGGWPTGGTKDMEPIWGAPGNDRIMQTETITARAVRYYYDIALAAEKNPKMASGVEEKHTELEYAAAIHYLDRYKHGEESYESVYVANLDLTWGFTCGDLCGMGFTRNKIVVLDRHGEVIAMYLDAPVNSESWVS